MKISRLHLPLPAVLALCAAGFIACRPAAAADKGVVRMVCSLPHPPYVYMHEGRLTGIDVDLAEMIAKEAGRELRAATAEFSRLIDMVHRNEADIAVSALSATHARRRLVDFSDPYSFDGMILLVRTNENLRYLTDIEDRAGFRISAESGSTGYSIMRQFLKDSGGRAALSAFDTIEAAAAALLAREVDAVVTDKLVAASLQLHHPGRMEILDDLLNHDSLSVAVSKGDPELLKAANAVIHRLWKTGELYDLMRKHAIQTFGEAAGHEER